MKLNEIDAMKDVITRVKRTMAARLLDVYDGVCDSFTTGVSSLSDDQIEVVKKEITDYVDRCSKNFECGKLAVKFDVVERSRELLIEVQSELATNVGKVIDTIRGYKGADYSAYDESVFYNLKEMKPHVMKVCTDIFEFTINENVTSISFSNKGDDEMYPLELTRDNSIRTASDVLNALETELSDIANSCIDDHTLHIDIKSFNKLVDVCDVLSIMEHSLLENKLKEFNIEYTMYGGINHKGTQYFGFRAILDKTKLKEIIKSIDELKEHLQRVFDKNELKNEIENSLPKTFKKQYQSALTPIFMPGDMITKIIQNNELDGVCDDTETLIIMDDRRIHGSMMNLTAIDLSLESKHNLRPYDLFVKKLIEIYKNCVRDTEDNNFTIGFKLPYSIKMDFIDHFLSCELAKYDVGADVRLKTFYDDKYVLVKIKF